MKALLAAVIVVLFVAGCAGNGTMWGGQGATMTSTHTTAGPFPIDNSKD